MNYDITICTRNLSLVLFKCGKKNGRWLLTHPQLVASSLGLSHGFLGKCHGIKGNSRETQGNSHGARWHAGCIMRKDLQVVGLEILHVFHGGCRPGVTEMGMTTAFSISGWWSGTSILFLFHRLGIPSSQLTFIFFRGLKPPTRYNYGLFNLISSDMRWYFPTTMGKNLEKYLQVLQPVNLGWVVINPSSFGTGIWGFLSHGGTPKLAGCFTMENPI